MIQQFFKISMCIGVIIGFSFLIYTNSSPKRKDKSIIYLNLFVFFFTINNLQITLADYGYIHLNFFERKLLIPFYALIIPAFYTFVIYYLKAENKIKSFVALSIFIFTIEIIIRIVFSQYYYSDNSSYIIAKYAQAEEMVNLIYTIFLFLKVVYIFLNQTKLYQEVASYDNMKWLKQFLIYGFGIIILWIIAIVFNIKEVISPNIPIYYPLRLSSSFIIFWIAYHGFFQYNLLTERIQLRKEIANDKTEKEISINQSANQNFILIQNCVLENQMYLNPDLCVENVASKIKITPKNVSHILQETTNFSFPDYINSLRVEKAKKYLTKEKYAHYTIISIGLECGFNSKSTFYRAFTKFTTATPTEYRQQNQ